MSFMSVSEVNRPSLLRPELKSWREKRGMEKEGEQWKNGTIEENEKERRKKVCRRRVSSGGQKKDGVKKVVLQRERVKEMR